MVELAEKVADGSRPLKKDRFVKSTDTVVDWNPGRAGPLPRRSEGYVTNIPKAVMSGGRVVAAYHDLYQVERFLRMAKSDLAARPMPTACASPSRHTDHRVGGPGGVT